MDPHGCLSVTYTQQNTTHNNAVLSVVLGTEQMVRAYKMTIDRMVPKLQRCIVVNCKLVSPQRWSYQTGSLLKMTPPTLLSCQIQSEIESSSIPLYGRFHVKGPRKKVNVKKWIFFL